MSTPTANKPTANKAPTAVAKPAVEEKTEEKTVERISSYLADNVILGDICRKYLSVVDEIGAYNKEVLAPSDSEWNSGKVLAKAREFAFPEDVKNVKPEVKKAYDVFEALTSQLSKARAAVIDAASKELGITLSATGEKDPEREAPLREKRKLADEIGKTLKMMAGITADKSATTAVEEFLENNPLPMVGRDGTKSFGADSAATPKYRVTITVTNKDGEEIGNFDGFTKTAQGITKPVFGYPRGEAPKSDIFRAVWEKAGNSAEKTVVNPVEFDDNDLHFVITKKS